MNVKDIKFEDIDPLTWSLYARDALEILEGFTDDEGCSYDHHGFCQTHYSGGNGEKCLHEEARELLADFEKEVNGE